MDTSGKNRGVRFLFYVLGAVVFLVFLAVAVLYISISNEGYVLPSDYVENQSIDVSKTNLILNEVVRYPAKANVSQLNASAEGMRIGVASHTFELNFGEVPQNITVKKFIQLRNNEQFPVRVCMVKRGNIASNIYIDRGQEDMLIPGGGFLEIELSFNSTEVGVYSGEVDIVLRKFRHDYLNPFIGFVRC